MVRWVVDVALVVVAVAASLPSLFRGNAHPPALAVPVLVAVAAPLIVRRFFPLPVAGWVLITAVAAGLWNRHVVAGLAVLIALYTVAALRPRRDALAAAAVLEAVILATGAMEAGSGWWSEPIFVSGLVGAALGLGLYTTTRRAYLAELQERALRLEYERDQQGELAAAAERARIAREMHDIVAHHLTVMVALSDGAVAATAASPERGIEVMRTVSATGRRALIDTRRLLGVLRQGSSEDPQDILQPVPNLAELDVLLERVRAAGLPATFEVHGSPPDVPAGIQLTVYRLVQEALTNTLKHGGPEARASVRLRYLPGELRVDVDDDGAGASASAPVGVGGGLSGMQERVHAYGGDVQSGPGRSGGWHVSARLRLDEGDVT
ncbi:MAG: integral rane sensor signal transduction histidine kinase [Pseudonocardiales bacterium]|nr:integral rane sensor signal transduction histidine kinase [Pseudonocardiales bacterium]